VSKRVITIEDLLRLKFVSDPQISPNGSQVIFTVKAVDEKRNRYLSHIWAADTATGTVRQLTSGEANDRLPRWSRGSDRIAFLRTEDRRTQIWIISATGMNPRQLTHLEEGNIGALQWSPNGSRLAFTFRPTHPDWTQAAHEEREEKGLSDPPRVINRLRYKSEGTGFLDCHRHIWICNAATGEARQITEGDYDATGPAWSPDGKEIAFLANRSNDPDARPYQVDIWIVSKAGGDLQKVFTPSGYKESLSWSPDGKQIAYIGCETQDDPWAPHHDRLWVAPLSGGSVRCLTASLDRVVGNATTSDVRQSTLRPIWSGDGQRLFFLVSDRGNCHLYTVPLEGAPNGAPESLVAGNLDVAAFSSDAEGRRFATLISRPCQPAEVFLWADEAGSPTEATPLTRMNAPLLEAVRLSEPREVCFRSYDGTEVLGWLLRPPDFDARRKYPLLLYIHGGPDVQYGNTFFHELQVHAARGYIVLYTNPRGSMGYGRSHADSIRGNWGDFDFQDLMAAADFAESLPYVDGECMAVAGGSYGGFMATWIVGHTDRFKCAITERGVSNRHSAFGTSDFPPLADGYWPGNAWDRPERLWEQSPLRHAANIRTPLLIIHSEGDLRCPIEQAEQLYSALKVLKRKVVFVRYPRETGHDFSRSGPPDLRIDRLRRICDWLDRHLMKSP